MASKPRRLGEPQLGTLLLFRVVGYVGIAILALLIPQTGEHRYVLAAALAFVFAPGVVLLDLKFRTSERSWVDPLVDIIAVILLIHLVPSVWYPALCIGLMVSLAPSISLHPASNVIYALYAIVLLGGMSVAGWVHAVDRWWISICVSAVIYPSVIFYAGWQVRRADVLRERAQFVNTIQRLAGNVAHNLNNSLTTIAGHAELVAEELPDDHPNRQDLAEVLAGVERAQGLSRQLLSVSTQRSDAAELIDLEVELAALIGLLESTVPEGVNIEFASDLDNGAVIAKRSELQSVAMNAILNAAEDSALVKSESTVTVALKSIERADGYWAQVVVSHQGQQPARGIVLSLTRLLGVPSTRDSIGLGGAERIIRANDGEMHTERSPDNTVTVTLRLPLVPTREAPPVQDPSRLQTGSVLLVDDETQVRGVIAKMLRKMGYSVTAAGNADEAMAAYRQIANDIKFAVMDLKMPGKDGWTCLKEMRDIRPDLPVIVISGFDPDESRRSEFSEQINFLAKPFNRAQLQRAVAEVVI